MDIKNIVTKNQLGLLFQKGSFGLEKESQRVYEDGCVVTTPHPATFGNRDFHPYIQTDFAESQLELITPVNEKIEDALRWLSAIHEVVIRSLPENEFIFPLSMPAELPPEEEIKIAQLNNIEDRNYRDYLAKTYGKNKQMISGIHYNFQLSPDFIKAAYLTQNKQKNLAEFQNQLYLKLAKNFLRYQWILVYLLSASPTVDKQFFYGKHVLADNQFVRSLRSGKYGYVNDDDIKVSYQSLQQYVETLEQYVSNGQLIAEKEFYSNIRFRGAPNARELLKKGIQYIELRIFDLNPFEPNGISLSDAKFIHYFILLMLWLDEPDETDPIHLGKERLEQVAWENPFAETAFRREGEQLLTQLLDMLSIINADDQLVNIVTDKLNQFSDPSQTLCAKLVREIEANGSYQKLGAHLATQYKQRVLHRYYALSAFDNMELSTQALLFDAIRKGINVELLDEGDQFLRLEYKGHSEYVKNGNMTSHDRYISPLIMENKVVTKKVLEKAGFNVPKSTQFTNINDAIASFPLFEKKAVVVKPKSTNFGLGISIFQQGLQDSNDFSKAVEIAFREDKEIMIEDYLVGTEYRFFVLADKTLAVLLRVPANVTGDGQSTVEQLVALKNNHPLRGDGSRTPLKKITLDEIEILQLKEQNLTPDSIPAEGQYVLLRANSNISTGGDSIDMTEEMHSSYKEIAVAITRSLGAAICGVDLIVPDLTQPALPSLKSWGVIEANFNPMMMMHIFPYQGKSRRVSNDVLQLLFPEIH